MLTRRNYLRVRGEYTRSRGPATCLPELPPRARRIRKEQRNEAINPGTTSACAENTHRREKNRFFSRNYLRVRGEYSGGELAPEAVLELPPRARRIHIITSTRMLNAGTTSACAENTHHDGKTFPDFWNYLRVRGEYPK